MRSNTLTSLAEITRRRPVSGDVSGKLAATPSEIRKFRVEELRAADRLVRRAEVLRAEAKRLLKMAEREEAKLTRNPERGGEASQAFESSRIIFPHPDCFVSVVIRPRL